MADRIDRRVVPGPDGGRRTDGVPEDPQERAVYVISVAAELAGVHPQTLRIYERKGLIEPSRTEGRSRRYSDRDIALLQRIQELTNEGVSLAGVRKVLDLEADLDDARAEVAALRAALARAEQELEAAVERVHRSYRRDLVPVSRAVVSYRRR
jgi:MerR family transcriptional regulator/heat shock protein HspR